MTEHINGYALALLQLANDDKKILLYKKDVNLILEAIIENPKYISILDSKVIEFSKKEKLIDKAFAKVNVNIKNLIKILAKRQKASLLRHILKKFIHIVNKQENIREGIVYSVEKLTPTEMKKISKKIDKMVNHKVNLENKIDKELISGIKVIVNDRVIEDSAISRLYNLKAELMKEREVD